MKRKDIVSRKSGNVGRVDPEAVKSIRMEGSQFSEKFSEAVRMM
jgi:hypothetical protein